MKNILFTILIFATSLLAQQYTAPMSLNGATTIDSKKAYELFNQKTLFLDVRPAWMIKEQKKIKSSINYYVRDINPQISDAIIKTKETPFIVYCNGVRCPLSQEAIEKFVADGYKKIYFYRDGYPAWKYYGLPVE